MKIGFIGLGNMAGTICQGLIKSDFIDGSEVYGYDINSHQLMMFEQDFGIHICSSEQDVVKNCDYLVMGVKPNVVENVIEILRKINWLKSEYSKKKLSKERRLKNFLKNEYFKVSLNEVSRDLRLSETL